MLNISNRNESFASGMKGSLGSQFDGEICGPINEMILSETIISKTLKTTHIVILGNSWYGSISHSFLPPVLFYVFSTQQEERTFSKFG